MKIHRATRKFASPTTNQPFANSVQRQLQEYVVNNQLLLHASRYWVTHSQAVRLCGTRPAKGATPAKVKRFSETVLPFESIEGSQRKSLLARSPPFFGLGVGIFVDGKWKQIKGPSSLVAQLNPTMADRRLFIDSETAVDYGLIDGKSTPKNAVALQSNSRMRLYHASQLRHPERCVPPEGIAINPSLGRRWVQPAHDVLVAAGVLMGYISPFWLTEKQATKHYGVQIVDSKKIVRTHLREGTAVKWTAIPVGVRQRITARYGYGPGTGVISLLDMGQWERIDHPRMTAALEDAAMWVTRDMVDIVVPNNKIQWAKIAADKKVDLRTSTRETFVNAQNTSDPRVIQPRDRAFILVSGRFVSQAFTDELMRVSVRREFISPLWFTRADLARMSISVRPGEKPVTLSTSSTVTEEYLYNAEDLVEFDDIVAENPPLQDAGHQVFLVNWRPVVAPGKISALNKLKRDAPLWISETEVSMSGFQVKPGAKRYKLLGGICGRKPQSGATGAERIVAGRQVFNAEQTSDPVRANALATFLVRNKGM